MFSKIMFLCVLLVLHNTLGFPQGNAGLDPTKFAGSFFQPIREVGEKQIKPIVGLFGAPLGGLSKATHGIVKRATDDEKSSDSGSLFDSVKKANEKQIQPIFGFFGEQLESFSKALGALTPSSSKKE